MEKKIDIQAFRDFLKKKRLPLTIEREALLEIMLAIRGHYSAEEFFRAAHRKNAVHDRATVYRVLPLFVEAGFIKVSLLPNGRKRYDPVRSR